MCENEETPQVAVIPPGSAHCLPQGVRALMGVASRAALEKKCEEELFGYISGRALSSMI